MKRACDRLVDPGRGDNIKGHDLMDHGNSRRKRARNDPVSRFIDLEARVCDSDEEEDDEDDEDHEGFIEDRDGPIDTPWTHFANMDISNREEGWVDLVGLLEQRYASGTSGTTHSTAEGNHRNERSLESHPAIASAIDSITRLPTNDEYPLWRVRCKIGLEEMIVCFLFHIALPRHEIRSAITPGSVKGCVYLEATMNADLQKLLELTPGVFCNRSGAIRQQIDFDDGIKLLEMHQITRQPDVGNWVQIRKGIYERDVGYVLSVNTCGVELLLIPRLPPPEATISHSNRDRSTPALFDYEIIHQPYDIKPVRIHDNTYSFRGNRFEHGLVVKFYVFDSVSTNVPCMPYEMCCLFLESQHPRLITARSTFPKPSEWHFASGDEVYILDFTHGVSVNGKRGHVTALRSNSVDFMTKEGVLNNVGWLFICKVIHEGDFVEITGGDYQGQTGWVDQVVYQTASIVRVLEKHSAISLSERTDVFETHVNLLKCTTVPHVLGRCPEDEGHIPRSGHVPWINTAIIISGQHALKTYPGIVKDVIRGQSTPSGLRVAVQITTVGPHMSLGYLILDYDSVVEASHGIKLYDNAPTTNELFVPRNWSSGPPKSTRQISWYPQSLIEGSTPGPTPGYATPIPEPSLSAVSPAWDPSSRTPHGDSDRDRFASPDYLSDSCGQGHNQHPLLDSRLQNAPLRVVVTGGDYKQKELTASVRSVDGRLSIRRQIYKSSEALLPEWVTPKYPNPTRDNGLLIIIKGDHCGKYVRRIHHRYEGKEAIVILAIVNRVARHRDSLAEERLDLDTSYLCVCEESKEDKQLNSSLMTSLREEARKTRAK